MNIQIIGDNFNVSDSTRLLITEKINNHLDKLLIDFAPEMKTASLRISKNKLNEFQVSLDMSLPGKEYIFAETRHLLLESALIDLSQQIEKQIEKYKSEL